jgi:MSHA biogenesis protein MshI
MTLSERELAVAVVRRRSGHKPVLEHCAVQAIEGNAEQAVAAAVAKLHLGRTPISGVVAAEDYQLIQVEAPEVLPSELRAAVRWRLRDVISFHIDDAVVDVFEIPDQSRRSQTKMMFAVAARSAAVERLANTLSPSAAALDVIDIPELCLRNLAAQLSQDQRGVALLMLGEKSAQLTLTRQGVLYQTRRIDFARGFDVSNDDAADADIDAAALALELQRSLDYYESHYDQTPIGDLVIVPNDQRAQRLAEALKSETSLKIGLFDVREIFEVPAGIEIGTGASCMTALGAALRVETVDL